MPNEPDEVTSEPTWDGDAAPERKPVTVRVTPDKFASGPHALAADRLGPFELQGKLGAGGMGVVYRALDTRLGRTVALKVLDHRVTDDPLRRQRFLREARAAAAAHHRNIATVFEVGEAGRELYLAMELVHGGSLRQLVRPGGMPEGELLALVEQIAAGLAAAHKVGVVHRDLKPDNIMLTEDGELRILDFGLARATFDSQTGDAEPGGAPLTKQGQILGTPGYMSPEQALGQPVDARTDVFAAGVVAYELACGRVPWRGDSAMALVVAVVRDPPEPLAKLRPKLGVPLLAVIDQCLRRDQSDRFADGQALLLAIRAVRGKTGPISVPSEPQLAPPPPSEPQVRPQPGAQQQPKARPGWRRWGLALAALLLVGVGSWFAMAERGPVSLRHLPEVGGGSAAQTAFQRAVQAYYDMDFKLAATQLDFVVKSGGTDPVVGMLAAAVRNSSSADGTMLPAYDQARAAVEGRGDATAVAVRYLSNYLERSGDGPQKAVADLDTVVAAVHDSYLLTALCAQVVPRAAMPRAAAVLGDLLAQDDGPMMLHSARLGLLMIDGHNAEALAAVDALMAKGRVHPELQGIRGMALMGLGRRPEAIAAFTEQLALDPNAYNARAGLLEDAMQRNDDTAMHRHEEALFSPTATRGLAGYVVAMHAVRLCARGRVADAMAMLARFVGGPVPYDEGGAMAVINSESCPKVLAEPSLVAKYRVWTEALHENPHVSAGTQRLARGTTLTLDVIAAAQGAATPPDVLQRRFDAAQQGKGYGAISAFLTTGVIAVLRGDHEAAIANAQRPPAVEGGNYATALVLLWQAVQLRQAGQADAATTVLRSIVGRRQVCLAETEDLNQLCKAADAAAVGQIVQLARARGDLAAAAAAQTDLKTLWPRGDPAVVQWLTTQAWAPLSGPVTPTAP